MKTEAFYPGDRVRIFDWRLFKNDKDTPVSFTVRPATVLRWYGRRASKTIGGYPYPSLIDVVFDHRPNEVSHGHFTNIIERL